MIIKEILNRRSVREFTKEEIPENLIMEILKAGYFAPSTKSNHALEFIIIKDQDIKNRIFDIIGQEFVKTAPILLVPVTNMSKTVCPIEDLSVASENMFLQATSLNIGSVWKNLDIASAEKVKRILGIPEKYMIINIIPIGFSEIKIEAYNEVEFRKEIIHQEKW